MLHVAPTYALSTETTEMASKCLVYLHKVGGVSSLFSNSYNKPYSLLRALSTRVSVVGFFRAYFY